MNSDQQRVLLQIARESVADAARVGPGGRFTPPPVSSSLPQDSELRRPAGAFVSLHDRHGAVRGCVGTTLALRPLVEVVSEMARAAALRDPRFDPVRPEEVAALELEISVLEAPVRISSLAELEIGIDGLLVMGRGRRGVLLPQVAEERGWDAQAFAEHTCMKAGLGAEAYRDREIELYKFIAEVFSERELRSSPVSLSL